MVLCSCESCKKTFARTAISPSTRIGSPREDMRWIAEIQRLIVELLNPPYVHVLATARPQRSHFSHPRNAAYLKTLGRPMRPWQHTSLRLVEISCFFHFGLWVWPPTTDVAESDARVWPSSLRCVPARPCTAPRRLFPLPDRECRQNRPHFQHPRKIANLQTQGRRVRPWHLSTPCTRG
jgi:hypothetical protein